MYTQPQINIKGLIRELSEPRPSRRVAGSANLGYWHPSTMFRDISSLTDSHPICSDSSTSHFLGYYKVSLLPLGEIQPSAADVEHFIQLSEIHLTGEFDEHNLSLDG